MRGKIANLLTIVSAFVIGSAVSLSPSELNQYSKGIISGLFFAISGINVIFSVLGINVIDLLNGPNGAILSSKIEMFNPAAGTVGYTLYVTNGGSQPAQNVVVEATATGNLEINRHSASWRVLSPGAIEELIIAPFIAFGTLSLDQEIQISIAWKDSWRTRKAKDSFNLRQLDQYYRDRALARPGPIF